MANNVSLKVAAALVAGVALGAVAGLLLAPAKGSDTRKKVMDGSRDLAESLKSKIRFEGTAADGNAIQK